MSTPTTTTTQTVQTRGIYHGLPVYPSSPTHKNLTALITGANGISGNYMLRVLSQSPERWSKIYCLSRRPPAIPNGLPPQAEHIAVDFLESSSEEIAGVLRKRGVEKVDYVFFYSYVQVEPKGEGGLWSDAEEMCRVNVALLKNFCEALPLASLKPKRIMLQTGAKNYGIHLGPATIPQEESHPRITFEPNFYYPQEDFLFRFCATQTPPIHWNICMPSFILGAVPSAAMNLVYPLGIFASVQKHLQQKLEFPADLQAWEATHVGSSSMLNGYLEEWCVLNEGAKNERFNAADSSPWTWGSFWPRLAEWYGVGWAGPDMDDGVYMVVRSKYDPPPRGFGPPSTFRIKYTLTAWARRPEVQSAWSEIITKHKLSSAQKLEEMEIDRIFGFTDTSLMGGSLDLSMNKARKMGWHGFVDTNECIKEVLGEFADLRMLPEVGK